MRTPRYSVKWTGFSVSLVLGLYKIHLTLEKGLVTIEHFLGCAESAVLIRTSQ